MSNSSINIGSQKVCGYNLGVGAGEVYVCNDPFNTLNFKTIGVAGGLDINATGDTIIISGGSGGAGEVNTASNVGGGAYGLFSTKVGTDLRFRSLASAGNVSLVSSGNLVIISGQSATASAAGLESQIQYNGGGGTGATGNTLAASSAFVFSASTQSLNLGNRGGAQPSGYRSFIQGYDNEAIGAYSHAQGRNVIASGTSSHAEGFNTRAIGSYSHAEGFGSCAVSSRTHAEGGNTKAIGLYSHSEGRFTCACGDSSHAQNDRGVAIGCASHASGKGDSGGRNLFACGYASFNHSTNNISQIVGHGAIAPSSAILGGCNHNIEVGNTNAAIIGGDAIKLTGTTYINTTAVDRFAIISTPSGSTVADRQILLRDDDTGIIHRAGAEGLILPSGTTAERITYPGISGTIRYNDDSNLVEVNTPYISLSNQGYENIGDARVSSVEYGGTWLGGLGSSSQSWNLNALQTGNSVTEWRTHLIAYDATNGYTKSIESVAVFFNNKGGGTSTQIGSQVDIYDITDDPSPMIVTLQVSSGSPEVEITQTGGVVRNYEYFVKNTFTFNKARAFK